MSDNPFDEDSDRTVIRPMPGGRAARTVRADQHATEVPRRALGRAPADAGRQAAGAELATDVEIDLSGGGLNPMVSAARPLLVLICRLSRTYSQPDAADLRERALRQIRAFERDANHQGLPRDLVIRARYALCAALDDVAQNTEWGSDGEWAARPLVVGFSEGLRGYEGIQSGVGFFRVLDDAKREPAKNLPLLELMYLCLSLGFLGELRVNQRPMAALDRVREGLFSVIVNQRKTPDATLSPHWQGETAHYMPPRAAVPAWVIGSAGLFVLGGLFVWLSTDLNAASDDVFSRMLAAPASHQPAIARTRPVMPPVMPTVAAQRQSPEPLATFLKPEIDQGLVSVLGDHATPVIRINARGMFASGSATVSDRALPLLGRIGAALNSETGPVEVGGYTDNQPIHTVRFPSNFQLSAARAQAAAAVIGRELKQPGRITARGHAEADMIAPNDTPEGREANRRIEIILRRPG